MMAVAYEILGELLRTEWHVWHRAQRRADGEPVLLKRPLPDSVPTVAGELLGHEYELSRELTVPGIPRVYELDRHGGTVCLVVADEGGTPLETLLRSGPLDLPEFFRLGIELCTVLSEVHRHDLVHGRVSPRSILFHPTRGEAWLLDFTFAWRSWTDGSPVATRPLGRHALPYVSPEQTGRMNRATDYRTDLYSLGITLYEALTATTPFVSDDPLELVHAHLARIPKPPHEVDPKIPVPVSLILMKLLGKRAEERYQSATGLREDLKHCAREWTARAQVADFTLGRQDVSDRFLISQKLYGRDGDVDALNRAFDRCSAGSTLLVVVSGYAGIGKTSLIQELYKPIVRQRGYFTAGKFDQIARAPYGALIQAFRGLLRQLLAEGEERLARWRQRLNAALGTGSGVLAPVIPEIELVLGSQIQPPVLGPTETQNRFQLAVQSLLGALAQKEHPLVVFLDDLQWADSATLALLKPLRTSADIRCLLLIGTYRDNEVDGTHPLTQALTALAAEGADLERISLGPLTLADLTSMIHDTLHSERVGVEPLAQLVLQKTGGNPFFVIQFLRALKEAGLLTFDYERGGWTFQMAAIARAQMTDNVIDLMTQKIQRLSPGAQQVLTLGACIGNQFELHTLAIVSAQADEAVAADLGEAVVEGLLVPAPNDHQALAEEVFAAAAVSVPRYAFLHDRVQQAAYAMIPDDRRQLVHLTVGRLLLEGWEPVTAEERLFDIAHHLNLGRALITEAAERLALARLNLRAGRKAKEATAYQAGLGYVKAGLSLLPDSHWDTDYDLMLALHVEAAECEYLSGNLDEAERAYDRLLARCRTRSDQAKVYGLKILQYEHTSRYADAMYAGRDGLALFGVSWPDSPEAKAAALAAELAAIDTLMHDQPIDALVDLPAMTDPEVRAVMTLRATLHTSCFLSGDKPLTLVNTSAMVRLSLAHGNVEESAYAYALYAAMLVGPIRGDHGAAYTFGLLAMRLNERLPAPALRAKILMMFAWAISIWRMPMEASIPYTREAFRLAKETGLFVDAAWAVFNEAWLALLSGGTLDALEAHTEHVAYIRRIQMGHIADAEQVLLQWGRALAGRTESPTSLSGETFDESAYRRTYQGQRLFEMFYLVATLALLCSFEQWRQACEVAERAEAVIRRDFDGTIWDALRVYYHALALAALTREGAEASELSTLASLNARLARWAQSSPHLFQRQYLIVSAELARLRGQNSDAVTLYEHAIEAAAVVACPRERALAAELYARFRQGRGERRAAAELMTAARDAYADWGAIAKVRDLEHRYPDLLTGPTIECPTGSASAGPTPSGRAAQTGPPASSLDLVTVMKAARAITSEIELEGLLRRLMRIVLENAGAGRGLLLLERKGELVIEAEGVTNGSEVRVLQSAPLEEAPLAQAVVHYVRRTGESVVLDDATADERFAGDPYVARARPRSVLCVPIAHQGRVRGLLYLENNLTTGAFTADRLEIMQILSAEAAISLENARLYGEMKEEVARRGRAEQDARAALAEVERLKNRLQAENVYLQEEIGREHNFSEMVGSSPALMTVLRRVEQVAPTDTTVLIHGETGVGKELIARAIHNRSGRKERPLVKVNCTAISAGLVESELFGHVKGAFTGALERRVGRFELADGGTIFLDEVGELPLETQAKLLRVLQEQEFEPVGSNRTIHVDVRIIAATNRDLQQAVQTGRFRADLFYRLNVFPVEVPPLRKRVPDIPQLVMFFLSRFGKRFGREVPTVSQATMDRFLNYSWPGNIRELQNIIERSVVVSAGRSLDVDPSLMASAAPEPLPSPGQAAGPIGPGAGRRETMLAPSGLGTLEDIERNHIMATLEQTRWVVEGPSGAARILKLHPNTLRSRMQKLGIRRPPGGIS
jgi:predicted ATPase/GAF domain-containing protein